jgi:hypothetical protein
MILEYRMKKARVNALAEAFDEAGRRKDDAGDLYEEAVVTLYNLQKTIMETFSNQLDDEDTIQ